MAFHSAVVKLRGTALDVGITYPHPGQEEGIGKIMKGVKKT